MAKIPTAESKDRIFHNWYKEIPTHWIRESVKKIIKQTDGNKYAKKLNKQQIYILMQEYGSPDFADKEDYNNFIDDPTIFEDEQVRDINVDLD